VTHEFDVGDGVVDAGGGGLSLRQKLNLVATVLLGIALALFVVQNTERQRINFLSFDPDMPLWLLVLGSAATGALIAIVGSTMWRRRRRPRQ